MVDPIVSSSAEFSYLRVDARPWFTASSSLPYSVDVRGSLDGAAWMRLARVNGGSKEATRILDVKWPHEIDLGVHRLEIVADVTFLRSSASDDAIGREERRLPAVSFALFDARRYVKTAATARSMAGVWFERAPKYDAFIRAAQQAPAAALEAGLPPERLSAWLDRMFDRSHNRADS